MDDRLLRALEAEVERLRKRLEVVDGWSEDADGIACRDDTIKLQDQRIEAQAAEIARLKAQAEKMAGALEALTAGRHHEWTYIDDALITMARAALADYRGK